MPLQSSTLTAIRQGLLDYLGLGRRGTTTADGATGGASFIDTTYLPNYPNNRFDYWYGFITSGTYSGQERRVSAFTSATGLVVPITNYGGVIVSGVTYELLPWQKTDIHYAINAALQEAFGDLKDTIINEDLVTGNALPTGSFEDFIASTTVPDNWALVGADAVSAKVTAAANKKYGLASVSLQRVGTDCYLHCSDAQWPSLLDLGGEDPYLECWVKASVASRARLGLSVDGGTPTYSGYHTGGGNFELLRKQVSITESPVSVSARCYVDTGNTTAYFDYIRLLSGRVTTYILPAIFDSKGPDKVYIQTQGQVGTDEDPCDDMGEIAPFQEVSGWETYYDRQNGYWVLRFTRRPLNGYKIRLLGSRPIDEVSAEADTVPLDPPQLKLLYPLAAIQLLGALKSRTSEQEGLLAKAQRDYQFRKGRLSQQSLPKRVSYGTAWRD